MKEYFILLIAIFLFVSFGVISKVSADKTHAAFNNSILAPMPTPQVEIEKFELDKTESLYICPYFQTPNTCGRDDKGNEISQLINVETVVRNPQNLPLIYEYKVSGGKITGSGEKVIWDLTKTRPWMSYTITVNVTDGKGFVYQTRSAEASVKECDCHVPCVCPTVAAFGGGNVKAGETVTFSAEVAGGSDTSNPTYKWTVSQGEIVEGQGAKQISVKTTKEMSGTIEATVEVTGSGLCENCRVQTSSETATIVK